MTDISSADIEHLARLARIRLGEEEKERLVQDLPKIVGFVDELSSLSGSVDQPVTDIKTLSDLRADEVNPDSLSLEQLAKLAPAWQQSLVEVPAVFGEEHE